MKIRPALLRFAAIAFAALLTAACATQDEYEAWEKGNTDTDSKVVLSDQGCLLDARPDTGGVGRAEMDSSDIPAAGEINAVLMRPGSGGVGRAEMDSSDIPAAGEIRTVLMKQGNGGVGRAEAASIDLSISDKIDLGSMLMKQGNGGVGKVQACVHGYTISAENTEVFVEVVDYDGTTVVSKQVADGESTEIFSLKPGYKVIIDGRELPVY